MQILSSRVRTLLFGISAFFALIRVPLFTGFEGAILSLTFLVVSLLATRARWIYGLGVALSAFGLYLLLSEPSRFFVVEGVINLVTLLGVLVPLALGCIHFIVHPLISGRWSE